VAVTDAGASAPKGDAIGVLVTAAAHEESTMAVIRLAVQKMKRGFIIFILFTIVIIK
jgi:hypothetical protein